MKNKEKESNFEQIKKIIHTMKKVKLETRNPRNCMESSYYLPVPMNDRGGVFSIPDSMVSKKGTIKLDMLEKYLTNHIRNSIKDYPYQNQFVDNNHILIDYVETYYSDRIIEEEDKNEIIYDWI